MRTLDRWAAKKLPSTKRSNTSVYEEKSNNIIELSSNSNEENIDHSIYDWQISNDSDSEINNTEGFEVCVEDNEIIVNNNDNNISNTNTLIYESSSVTVDQSVFNLVDFYIQHKLSKSALKGALKIQLAILPSENRMPKTIFKLLQYVEDIAPRHDVTKHYYCKNCLLYIGITIENILKCPSCSMNEKNFNLFFEFNLEDQLKHFFESKSFVNKIKRSPLERDPNVISNITEGTEYIRVNSRKDRREYDLTLILNTDGLSLVKSANSHCWPLMYTIAELPENLRESFIIILGLWYDPDCKPNMNTFLQPFCTELKRLYYKGFKWIHPETKEELTSKVVAPLFIADAPARANLQNILLYNGTYGCNICEIMSNGCKKMAGKKTTRIYSFEKTQSALRTSDRMKRQAQMREIFAKTHCKGVKGFSILSTLPLLDLGSCVLPEYMHSVLLGVVKSYTNLLLNKPGAWNVKSNSKEMNNFMKTIKPPQSFNRLPRAITDFKYYKASEFYNWILFYCLPTLINYLPDKYFQHLMLLVMALYDLLQDHILIQPDLERAQNWLDLFVEQTPKLYSDREMTYNHHQLRHLGLCVRRWGPLRSISAFPYENKNGYIAHCVHGTKNMGQEIVNSLKIVQGVQMLKYRVEEKQNNKEAQELKNYMLLGSAIDGGAHENDLLILESGGFVYDNLIIYARAKIFKEIYTSLVYKTIKTNSYTVEIKKVNNSCVYGMIKFFFESENELYFIIEKLKVEHSKMMSHINIRVAVKHILPVRECGKCLLIKLKDVTSIFQLVKVGNYVCKRPDKSKRIW